MRTTVTLDSDVEQLVRERMEAKGVSFKVALNDAIREGASQLRSEVVHTPTAELGIRVDIEHANRIAADLEDLEIGNHLQSGR
jgi:hypothetical protein